MRIVTVGAGYVGLATAVGFATHGHDVCLIDIDPVRVDQLRSGTLPFHDASLADGLRATVSKTLTVSDWDTDATGEADIAFICVDTPPDASGSLDVVRVHECAARIAEATDGAAPIVVRSTVNLGTSREIEATLRRTWSRATVVANPEFLREGCALDDFDRPDRRVIGGGDARALRMLEDLYAFSPAPVIVTDATTAELAKLASNAALAVRVSFANEVAAIAIAHGADPETALAAVGADARIGARYLEPGLGFGGVCLPKDLDALRASADRERTPAAVVRAAAETNASALEAIVDRVARLVGAQGSVCVVGVAFKPGSDSVRGSRGLLLVRRLLERGLAVSVYDPPAEADARATLRDATRYLADPAEAAEADAVVIAHPVAGIDPATLEARFVLDALGREIAVAAPAVAQASSA